MTPEEPEVAGEQAQVLSQQLAGNGQVGGQQAGVAVPSAVSAGVGTFGGFASSDARGLGLGGLMGVGLGLVAVGAVRRRTQTK